MVEFVSNNVLVRPKDIYPFVFLDEFGHNVLLFEVVVLLDYRRYLFPLEILKNVSSFLAGFYFNALFAYVAHLTMIGHVTHHLLVMALVLDVRFRNY